MEKLKSSIKSLQETITSLKPIAPTCILDTKTHSFREGSRDFSHVAYCTPSSSSSSSSAQPRKIDTGRCLPEGPVSSTTRFFFSPRTTKSIMEEAKPEAPVSQVPPEAKMAGSLWEESVSMAMASDDPYMDFKLSMEEMVEAYGLREWTGLQELLHCYLSLNERKTHKVIVMAFVDLLMSLMAQDSHFQPLCSLDQLKPPI